MALEAIADSIKLIAVLASIVVIAYSGLLMVTSRDPYIRNQWKEVILGVLIGLCIIFLAPWLASTFSGGEYCG